MAKKNFKSGLDDLFKENLHEINNVNKKADEQEKINITGIDLNDISDEKLKWLVIKLQRYEQELKLWRTGKLTPKEFQKSLEKFGLHYDAETNQITKK
jgi:hypothetical protein